MLNTFLRNYEVYVLMFYIIIVVFVLSQKLGHKVQHKILNILRVKILIFLFFVGGRVGGEGERMNHKQAPCPV